MLKKTLIFAFLFSISTLSFAKNSDSTLTLMPDNPQTWGYINAAVEVNHTRSVVNNSIELTVSTQDKVSLIDVAAMNAHPKIDISCQDISIRGGMHRLLFRLERDWKVYCQYL